MSSETRWGVWLHAVRPVVELASLAAAAESLGAGAVLVADEGTDRDLFVTLAVLAQSTRRVLLFGAVTNPHSRHPVATAAAFASLAELAPGRIVAGFGAGGSRVLVPMGFSPARPFTALVECIDVAQALWRGETVDHAGEFRARGASIPWSAGSPASAGSAASAGSPANAGSAASLPVAVAGRGPRVERFGATRADWILLAGRATDAVGPLVDRLRASGQAARGRPACVGWNPVAAWTDALIEDARAHLAYMVVDLPAAERLALGVDDARAARIRGAVNSEGPSAAAPLVPDAVLDSYAVYGSRAQVVERLRELIARVRPELLLFEAGDYSIAFIESAASVALDAGAMAVKNGDQPHGLDSHRPA